MQHFLEFDPFDNPMQLSKVGNWVITFVSLVDQTPVELAITYVLPRQLSDQLQPRRVLIQQAEHENRWCILGLECFDSYSQKELTLDANHLIAKETLAKILQEFEKYDVMVKHIAI